MIAALLVLLVLSHVASAYSEDDIDYNYAGTETMYKNDTYELGNYLIRTIDFSVATGMVFLNISCGNESTDAILCNGTACNESNELVYDDEIKIEVTEVSGDPQLWIGEISNPHAEIEFYERRIPELAVSISSYKEEHSPHMPDIPVTIEIKNRGDIEIEDVEVMIDTGGLSVLDRGFDTDIAGGRVRATYENITDGDTESIYLRFVVPHLPDVRSFTITANATGTDIKDVIYTGSDSCTVLVLPESGLEIEKWVNSHVNVSKAVNVRISVINTGITDIDSITLSDKLPDSFESSTTPVWNFSLESGEEISYSYNIFCGVPGEYELPEAITNFSFEGHDYSISSNSPALTVEGSFVKLTKTVDPVIVEEGGSARVTLAAENTGNMPAKVRIEDKLPDNVDFVEGGMIIDMVIAANETVDVTYTISAGEVGIVQFPPPLVSGISNISAMPAILIVNQSEITTATPFSPEDVLRELPGFEGLFMIAIVYAVYLRSRCA
ncbi:MAG: hypothetical protein U9N36_05385 [Euryarchaeota archaeon]|nr:hypothetical protein [Euryarchaeota archaeon]